MQEWGGVTGYESSVRSIEGFRPLSSPWRDKLERRLRGFEGGRLAIVGVGNPLRGDDGAGSLLARRLAGRGLSNVFDGGSAPENYAERIATSMPEVVIVVDAACFGGRPGDARLLSADEVAGGALSTHDSSLRIFAGYLEERCGCGFYVIGIEPASRGLGAGLSPEVVKTMDVLEEILAGLVPDNLQSV
jgi:hydrogenase 3 maturation protease